MGLGFRERKSSQGFRMKLNEGDTLHLGHRADCTGLSWVPLSCAYDIDNPFVPQLDAADTVDEETDEANRSVESLSDNLEGLERLFFNEDLNLSMQNMSPATFTEDELENEKENGSPSVDHLEASEILVPDYEEENFTPDKENASPNSILLRSLTIESEEKSKNEPILYTPISSSVDQDEEIFTPDKENMTPNSRLYRKKTAMLKGRANRVPFCPLPVSSPSDNKTDSKPSVCENNTTKVAEIRWIIVVDTACLLNKKSRNELQLLRGLRDTTLVIPRIVVRELDCMLRRGGLFTRTSEVSAALQYIEECMAVAKWWVHVQSSAEEGRLVPPTPPASSSPRWLGEDVWASSIGSSTPFSPCSLQEIATPTAADHILDYALYYKRIRKDGQLGVLCETAQEFRRSLVNPFSARFLYSNCSPIGPTWSCEDDTVLKEKYYPSPSKKIMSKSSEGGVKGLKLILMHNSSFRQIKPVS
ncbi:hypothetical protein PHJA_000278600 [Phtheirospermum japonicum]|uniref:PIN domain-containing protein n=1 Tax=Phtheirospermum japonicum TaxID=374723 RepID=A0A830BAB2_9LAMI|nr:hypothetical protein PHJA_000278600 [Phtheirospermum japonicum]